MKTILSLTFVALLVCLGCANDENASPKNWQQASTEQDASRKPLEEDEKTAREFTTVGGAGQFAMAKGQAPAPPQGKPVAAEPLLRKIIRSANIKVIVDDFAKAEQELKKLIDEQKGSYVAKAEITGSPGAPRSGLWTIRVPVVQFESFVDSLLKLGVPQKNSIDSKDVTEEYYDVEARIKNKKVEEDRLLKHLEKSTGKLDEILKVEAEISRVRGDIEQMEGRLHVLANLSALTTVTLQIQEIKDYVPPQAPTYSSSIASTFSNSYDMLVNLGKNLFLVLVALTPWLPVIAVVIGLPWYFFRKRIGATQQPS